MSSLIVLRWIARLLGVASSLILLTFAFGGREHLRLTTTEAIAFLFFPIGVIAGFCAAWWHGLAGGLITVGSLFLFYLFMFAIRGHLLTGPYFLLFAIPGFLHVGCALIEGLRKL